DAFIDVRVSRSNGYDAVPGCGNEHCPGGGSPDPLLQRSPFGEIAGFGLIGMKHYKLLQLFDKRLALDEFRQLVALYLPASDVHRLVRLVAPGLEVLGEGGIEIVAVVGGIDISHEFHVGKDFEGLIYGINHVEVSHGDGSEGFDEFFNPAKDELR